MNMNIKRRHLCFGRDAK